MSAKPKIDDQFWFDYSEKLVSDSITRLDNSISSVQKFTTGLLTTYTASAIFTIEYKDIENVYLLILFALPYIVVLFGQWHSTSSTIPKSNNFDPRIPSEIREVYIQIHTFKEERLKTTIYISLAATILVAMTLMLGFVLGNKQIQEQKRIENQKEAEKENYFNGKVLISEKKLLISGHIPPEAIVLIEMTHFTGKDTLYYAPNHFINSKEGFFFANFEMDTIGKGAEVYLEWTTESERKAIIKYFDFTKKK